MLFRSLEKLGVDKYLGLVKVSNFYAWSFLLYDLKAVRHRHRTTKTFSPYDRAIIRHL